MSDAAPCNCDQSQQLARELAEARRSARWSAVLYAETGERVADVALPVEPSSPTVVLLGARVFVWLRRDTKTGRPLYVEARVFEAPEHVVAEAPGG